VRTIGRVILLVVAAGCASTPPPPAPPPGGTPEIRPTATPAATSPMPRPTPLPTPPSTAPVPAERPSSAIARPIRVLLERTTGTVALPQPGRPYLLEADTTTRWLWGPIEVVAVADTVWQIGAWSGAATADEVVGSLAGRIGPDVQIWSEPTSSGLFRVRVRWPGGDPPDAAARLEASGFPDAFRVAGNPKLRLRSAAGAIDIESEILLSPAASWPTAVGERRYRGRFRVRLVGSELLMINELDLESYLRGVVPVEMGPYVFPELEALKAQAVAARTYAVAHLGDHDDEGWDICDTPACQAYHGVGAEHPLSDRAVAETAGLIAIYGGAPIDAMYTSTCGGRTEDAALLFPDRAQPYLRGVSCSWERPMRLAGSGGPGRMVDRVGHAAAVARLVLDTGPGPDPDRLVAAVRRRTGITERSSAVVDVESYATVLLAAAGIDAPPSVVRAPPGLDSLLVLCDLYDIELPPPIDGLRGDWPAAAALAVLELRGDVVRDSGEAVPHSAGVAIYPRRADAAEPLPEPVPLWEVWAGGYQQVSAAEVLPGTPLERLRVDDRVVALVVRRSGGAGEADRRSAWRSWVRDRDWKELSVRLGVPDLDRLTVTRRGASGRVVEMVAHGRSGTELRLEGFPIRRALDLPENLFTMHVYDRPDGSRAVRFLGRGWGHGIGLCQNGAYGLARAGMTFDAILEHYYTGIEVEPWASD